MDRFRQQCLYEAEGASAAEEGLTREDCPYEDKDSEAWNFWVRGNEKQQDAMVQKFMAREGTEPFLMSTAPLITPYTEDLLRNWTEKYVDANKRMREAKGWKPIAS